MSMKSLSKYFVWIWMGVKSQLAYRAAIVDRLLGFFVRFIVLYYFWQAVYADNVVLNGRSFLEMVTYIFLSLSISSLYISPSIYFISEDIKSGNIIYLLLKPMDYQLQFICKQLGIFLYMLVIISIVFVTMYSLIVSLPIPMNPLYFLISLILGLLTVVSFDFLMGQFCFWTENSWGLTYFQFAIVELLSGTLIPLDFFPRGLQNLVIKYLPFQGIVYTPISLFQNVWTGPEFFEYLMKQLAWITLFLLLGRFVYQKARKIVLINGG